ncbi:hypothetical protein ACOZ38_33750 [Sphaerisporangium viridialbum]|uniref:hypothetical protein n=1 Tax=Sphaerisporangium viridialbum TaxID=46189 RepID=UPI003C7849D4
MVVSMIKSVKRAARKQSVQEALARRFTALEVRTDAEHEGQETARRRVYDEALVPFSEVFSRLKNVDLAELATIGSLVEADLSDVELREVQVDAVGTVAALVGGVAAGAGIGALTYTAVGALAAASTGTAISALSGAAATSATLAWLGGGSLAAGGGGVAAGTMVLTGIVAFPVVLSLAGFLEWKGRKPSPNRERWRRSSPRAPLNSTGRRRRRTPYVRVAAISGICWTTRVKHSWSGSRVCVDC